MSIWLEKLDVWTNRHRPTALLLTVTLTIGIAALVNSATGSDLFQQLFYPNRETVADVRFWSALVYATAFGMGLPVAFLLWHWRDRNVRDQIENSRKDVNLREFVEVQKMAAGLFDEKMDKQAQTDLQIAALHQLSDFLGDHQPTSFRRAAFELLWPSDGISNERIQSFNEWKSSGNSISADAYRNYIEKQFHALDRVALARIAIIYDEWKKYFQSGFPLKGRDFSFLTLPINADLSALNFSECRFIRAALDRVNFDKSIMWHSLFDGAFANGACFSNTHFFGASFVSCGLSTHIRDDIEPRAMPVNFQHSELGFVNFHGAVVVGAQLQGTKVFSPPPKDAQIVECLVNQDTEFNLNWSHMTPQEKDTARSPWLERGMIKFDARPPEAERDSLTDD